MLGEHQGGEGMPVTGVRDNVANMAKVSKDGIDRRQAGESSGWTRDRAGVCLNIFESN
jgi:hypothetical protein